MRINTKQHNSGWLWPLLAILAVILLAWWGLSNQIPQIPGGAATTSPTSVVASGQKSATTQKAGTDIVSVLDGISSASVFASWVQSTGVSAELSGAGPYTLFVPTNDVIAQLPSGTFRNLSAAGQKRFVEYHVIVGKVIDADAQVAGTVQTLSGDPINFTRRPGQTALVGSGAITATYKASNGVVYLVNAGLVPPQKLQ